MEILDGRKLAAEIDEETRAKIGARKLSLGIVTVGATSAIGKFVEQKKKKGRELGVNVRVYPREGSAKKLRAEIAELVKKTGHDGFVVQLPIAGVNPEQQQYVVNGIPADHDIDCLTQVNQHPRSWVRFGILPPVVGAVETLIRSAGVELRGREIAVIGAGFLVGRPVALWLLHQNIPFTLITEETKDAGEKIKKADVIISGAGKAHFINGDMIQEGAIVIDAGTSEKEGSLAGDVDPLGLETKTGWLSPVPGGVGPLTVSWIFRNLACLAAHP